MAARGVDKSITSPINPILLLLMSGKLICLLPNLLNLTLVKESMFLSLSLFHFLLKSHHNLHHDIASIMFPSSLPSLEILIVYYVTSPNILCFVSSLYHPAPSRSTHLHLFSPPNRPTRTHMPLKCKVDAIKGISKSYFSSPPFSTFSPYPSPCTHPPHANTAAAIQNGRITNCS